MKGEHADMGPGSLWTGQGSEAKGMHAASQLMGWAGAEGKGDFRADRSMQVPQAGEALKTVLACGRCLRARPADEEPVIVRNCAMTMAAHLEPMVAPVTESRASKPIASSSLPIWVVRAMKAYL